MTKDERETKLKLIFVVRNTLDLALDSIYPGGHSMYPHLIFGRKVSKEHIGRGDACVGGEQLGLVGRVRIRVVSKTETEEAGNAAVNCF